MFIPISDPCHTAGEKRTTFLASYESGEVDDLRLLQKENLWEYPKFQSVTASEGVCMVYPAINCQCIHSFYFLYNKIPFCYDTG